jgi:hypothetical protein
MSIQEARQLIADPDASMMARIEASSVLSLSDDATIMDLVDCLRCRGVIAELAAVGLYRRTGRPKPKTPPRLREPGSMGAVFDSTTT